MKNFGKNRKARSTKTPKVHSTQESTQEKTSPASRKNKQPRSGS